MKPFGEWPMSHAVMTVGMVLALATGARILLAPWVSPWAPPESWLLFITACLTVTYATKRATFTGLWRKAPADGTTTKVETTTESTTTKGAPPAPEAT